MQKADIKVGLKYLAKVSGKLTTVRVDAIREKDNIVGYGPTGPARHVKLKWKSSVSYDVTNLETGRKTTFRSAAKFRGLAMTARQAEKHEVLNRISSQYPTKIVGKWI